MTVYRVQLQQYVEMICSVEVEADTPEEAKDKALLNGGEDDDWKNGGDAREVEAWAILDNAGNTVWER